jgi:peptidoglycan/LPS O-acetylase OafA/YrhL
MVNGGFIKLKRIIGILIVILAIGIAVIPQFTKCDKSMMACNYTAKAEIALAIPVFVEGLILIISGQKSQLGLAFVGAALGLSVILVAYVLIGTCGPMMDCTTIMKPVLLVLGLLLILVNGWLLWDSKSKMMQ